MSIYVGNLSYQVTEEDLKKAFAEYGTVGPVQLPTDRETGRPRGFAFVEMEKEADETKWGVFPSEIFTDGGVAGDGD
jgi:RNA recognition motif-containing protein